MNGYGWCKIAFRRCTIDFALAHIDESAVQIVQKRKHADRVDLDAAFYDRDRALQPFAFVGERSRSPHQAPHWKLTCSRKLEHVVRHRRIQEVGVEERVTTSCHAKAYIRRNGVSIGAASQRDARELPQSRAASCQAAQAGDRMLEVGPVHPAADAELGAR